MASLLKPKRVAAASKKKPPAKRLTPMAELKRRLAAGADTTGAKAMANTRKLTGSDIL